MGWLWLSRLSSYFAIRGSRFQVIPDRCQFAPGQGTSPKGVYCTLYYCMSVCTFVSLKQWKGLQCKALWVARMTTKALYKSSLFYYYFSLKYCIYRCRKTAFFTFQMHRKITILLWKLSRWLMIITMLINASLGWLKQPEDRV